MNGHKTLSLCSGANEDVMCRFLLSTNLVSTEEKYELAVRIMFIYFVFKFPYYEKILACKDVNIYKMIGDIRKLRLTKECNFMRAA
mgnify:CR=1 FL=1